MLRSLVIFLILTCFAIAKAETKSSAPKESLADLISPEELREELNLSAEEDLEQEGEFTTLGIDQWNDLNGLDVTEYFEVVVLVNKATKGPTAQTAQVFFDGQYYTSYTISTGRERMENAPSGKNYFSATPTGWFKPQHLNPNHYSRTWEAPMKWAVFFHGGIALHATTPSHYKELGRRASGGCVRLHEDDADELYHLIKGAGKAYVPRFNRNGQILTNRYGEIKFRYDYNVLIIVEDTKR